jgi:hypothetical protein
MKQTVNSLYKNTSLLFAVLMFGTLMGLLFSRSVLSIMHIVWLLFSLVTISSKRIAEEKKLFIWSCLPILFFWLGAWQTMFIAKTYDYLLSLIVYPIVCICVIHIPNKKIIDRIILIWVVVAIASTLYPLLFFVLDAKNIIQAYGAGQSLATPMDTDHVRYSIFLCSALPLIFYKNIFSRKTKTILSIVLTVIIIFLSVRTGWMALLIFWSIYGIVQFVKNPKKSMIWFLGILISLTLVYYTFPTVQKKIAYSVYDWQKTKSKEYEANYSDATRYAINKAAISVIQNNKNVDAGWENVALELNKSFAILYPKQKLNYNWPFNQFLFWYIGSSWWGLSAFCLWLLFPIFYGIRHKKYLLVSWQLIIIASCFVECTLNFQYGIFLHIWPLAFLWKSETIE